MNYLLSELTVESRVSLSVETIVLGFVDCLITDELNDAGKRK